MLKWNNYYLLLLIIINTIRSLNWVQLGKTNETAQALTKTLLKSNYTQCCEV